MKKIIFITVVDGFHYRYLIDTGIVDNILNTTNSNLHIFTIESLVYKLEEKYKDDNNVYIYTLVQFKSNIFTKMYLKKKQLSNIKLAGTLNIKSENQKDISIVKKFLLKIIPFSFLESYFISMYYRNLISKLTPDLIILSTPSQKPLDYYLAYEANRANIKVVSPVYSWDNLTAKGPFYFDINYLIVWNKIMQEEAIHYHGYTSSNCFIAGVPVFDIYASMLDKEKEEKEGFFNKLNLDNNKKLITITTIPQIYFGSHHNTLIDKIRNYIIEGNLKIQILVRPHPMDETDYSKWNDDSIVKLDYYGSKPDSSLINWNPQKNNTRHLGLTMKYSNVVINIASTITIDAACFNTPIINIAYDMKRDDSDYTGSIKRYYQYTHYKHVVTTNAAKLVYSDKDLFKTILLYIENPNLGTKERKLLVEKQTNMLDGKSTKRISRIINDII
jgi:hypothetical protein